MPERVRPGFFGGLRYPFRGARFVYVEHRELAKFWLPPILLTTTALVAVIAAALRYREDVVQLVWEMPVGEGTWLMLERGLRAVFEWIVAAAMMVLGVVVVALSTSIVAAPFNDALSEAVESSVTGRSAAPLTLRRLLGDMKRTIGLESLKLAMYVGLMVPLFVLSLLLPVVGPAVYSIAGFYFTVLFFALDYSDWPASRHDFPVRRRLGAAFRHSAPMLGLGVGVWLFMFIPLVNLFFMPAAVAGGTLMFLDLHDSSAPKYG